MNGRELLLLGLLIASLLGGAARASDPCGPLGNWQVPEPAPSSTLQYVPGPPGVWGQTCIMIAGTIRCY